MIRPLRQRHRRMVIALGVLLPIAFAAGIAARRSTPAVVPVLSLQANAGKQFEAVEWERAGLFANPAISVRLRREKKDSGAFAVEFAAPKDFLKPDLIVYWVAGNSKPVNKLPDEALLLGAFTPGVALPLPVGALSPGGVMVLYSLVDQELVDVSKTVSLQRP